MLTLRPYQDAGVSEIRERFIRDGFRRVLFVLPTGGGKTVLLTYMTARSAEAGKRVWIVVHRDVLIQQVSASMREFNIHHGIICGGHRVTDDLVQVCSIQTLARRLDRLPAPDLIIFDEAHHCAAGQWFQTINHHAKVPMIGVTATPCRLDGKGLGNVFETMVLGPTAAELTEWGFLAPAVIYSPQLADTSGLHTRMGDFKRDEAADLMDKPIICGEAVSFYKRFAYGKRIIVFCVNLNHVEHTCDAYNAAGIPAAALDGSLSTAERNKRVADFAAGRTLALITCELVNEGFDVPGCEAVQLLRPTQSESLYLQQVGRALRPAPGKTEAIILDHVGNVGRMVNGVFVENHGLPTKDRHWELNPVKKSRRTASSGGEFSIRQCLKCYNVYPAFTRACPRCGYAPPVEDRTPEVVDGELARVAVEPVTPEMEARLMESAKTLEDWHAVARRLGKSSRWAYKEHSRRVEKLIYLATRGVNINGQS